MTCLAHRHNVAQDIWSPGCYSMNFPLPPKHCVASPLMVRTRRHNTFAFPACPIKYFFSDIHFFSFPAKSDLFLWSPILLHSPRPWAFASGRGARDRIEGGSEGLSRFSLTAQGQDIEGFPQFPSAISLQLWRQPSAFSPLFGKRSVIFQPPANAKCITPSTVPPPALPSFCPFRGSGR